MAGFSLLELIIAMSMVAMLALTLYASLRVTTRAKRSAEAAVAPVRTATIAADLLSQDLQSVLPPTGILAGPFVGLRQDGLEAGTETDVLSFCCIDDDGVGNPQPASLSEGIRRVELAVRTDVRPPVLVRRVTRNLLASVQQQPEEEILCRGVRSFVLRYSDGVAWYDQWDSTTMENALPVAVELTLDLLTSDPSLATQPPRICRISRIIPLSCAKPADTT